MPAGQTFKGHRVQNDVVEHFEIERVASEASETRVYLKRPLTLAWRSGFCHSAPFNAPSAKYCGVCSNEALSVSGSDVCVEFGTCTTPLDTVGVADPASCSNGWSANTWTSYDWSEGFASAADGFVDTANDRLVELHRPGRWFAGLCGVTLRTVHLAP